MSKTSEILHKALVSCGDDAEASAGINRTGKGLFYLLNTEPVTIICDRLAQKLKEQGYRVTKTLDIEK